MAWAEVYFDTKWHLDPSSRLATIDMGRELAAVPLLGGAGSPSNTWIEAYLHTKWHPNPSSRLAMIDMGRKCGGLLYPLFWGKSRGPHLTRGQGQGLPPHQVAS